MGASLVFCLLRWYLNFDRVPVVPRRLAVARALGLLGVVLTHLLLALVLPRLLKDVDVALVIVELAVLEVEDSGQAVDGAVEQPGFAGECSRT